MGFFKIASCIFFAASWEPKINRDSSEAIGDGLDGRMEDRSTAPWDLTCECFDSPKSLFILFYSLFIITFVFHCFRDFCNPFQHVSIH